ncbi:hypothetical protein BKX95_10025 [Streptococcus iniae]|nr:hypothetical protein BKX95_10025 [Streptococcus iniae]
MNYRTEIIKKINELDKKNNRIVDLAKGQLELLDQTKASKETYKDFYQDIKELTPIENTPIFEQKNSDIQTSLDKYAEENKIELKQDQEQSNSL